MPFTGLTGQAVPEDPPPSGRRLTLGSNAMVPTSTADAEPSTGITAPLT
jgi:hypothetical protein